MNCLRLLRATCAGVGCIGLILPPSVLEANQQAAANQPSRAEVPGEALVGDVELDSRGTLRGVVINVHGIPVAGTTVVLRQAGSQVARTVTDPFGCFALGPLRGGTYELLAGRQGKLFRVWAADSAPLGTRRMALIVVGSGLVRGQMPLEEFCCSDAFVITGLVAALIAIPIAVHNSGDRTPCSP